MKKLISTISALGLSIVFQASVLAQTITNQPQSITVNNASTATFTVGATNATTYQWKFNGSNLTDVGNITGSATSTLVVDDVSSNQAGNYSVEINGSVTSSNAVLTLTNGTMLTLTFSGFLDGGTSNVTVQLFDHDKPATVQNFIHYITSGAFSNMFYQRCVPGFVLQGGSYGASNRTDSSPPISGWDIPTRFIEATNQNPPFPPQVDSEFGVGPVIPNHTGTLAMALGASEFGETLTNSATCGFFFNLVDNSGDLDGQQFTVFGRVINGTNVLAYFNTLSNGGGIVTNVTLLDNGTLSSNPPNFTTPVNYAGTSLPANSNLVFFDYAFQTGPPADTNPPALVITSPAPGVIETNNYPTVSGTASDNVAVAVVYCVLVPQAAADGTSPNGGVSITNFAVGTTNWSATLNAGQSIFGSSPLPAGTYQLKVVAQDGAGNATTVSQSFIVSAITVSGNGSATYTYGAYTNLDAVGYPFVVNSNYVVQAVPGSNQTFVEWSSPSFTSTNAALTFSYEDVSYSATFISNSVGGIAFTSPTNDAVLSNTLFNITGNINTGILTPPVTVTCQIFTNSVSNFAVTLPQSTVGTNNWVEGVTNFLPTGSYFIQALATDQSGNNTLISESFNFIADTNPPSVAITSPAPGGILYETTSLLVTGTAASDGIVPLASVTGTLVPLTNAADGVVPDGGISLGGTADGTTNWTLALTNLGAVPPGAYTLRVQSKDAAGNVSSTNSQPLTISGIQIVGEGSVILTQSTNIKSSAVGYPLQYGTTYKVSAKAAAGYAFVNWIDGDFVTTSTNLTFYYANDLLVATFIPTNTPRGTKGISFTYPAAGARLTTNNFLLKGTIAPSVKTAQITCRISSRSSGFQAGPVLNTSGTNTWSVAVTNLPPDAYVVVAVATNSTGFSTYISEDFYVLAFKEVAGTYSGLFLNEGPIAPTNSGFCTFTVTASGAFTGKMLFPAYAPVVFNNAFTAAGTAGTYNQPFNLNFPSNAAYVFLNLDLTNGTDELTGYIYKTDQEWVSPIVCYREATKLSSHTMPATGNYVLSLNPTNWADTNGYAAFSVTGGGAVAMTGALPDGSTFSESTTIGTNGLWPLYAVPTGYKTNGMLVGWMSNAPSGDSSGSLFWHKGSNFGSYFTGGVNTNVNATGTNFSRPASGSAYTIVFAGGSLGEPLTNALTVNAGGQFVVPKPAPADKLVISLAANGVITGSIVETNSKSPLQFKGAFLSPSQGGSGFLLEGDGQTGYFLLQLQ